jgi:hypothetical protein
MVHFALFNIYSVVPVFLLFRMVTLMGLPFFP